MNVSTYYYSLEINPIALYHDARLQNLKHVYIYIHSSMLISKCIALCLVYSYTMTIKCMYLEVYFLFQQTRKRIPFLMLLLQVLHTARQTLSMLNTSLYNKCIHGLIVKNRYLLCLQIQLNNVICNRANTLHQFC